MKQQTELPPDSTAEATEASKLDSRSPDQVDGLTKPHLIFLSLLFLLLVTVVVFWRHLFAGYTFPWDFTATSRWDLFVINTIASGHFTEWVPYVGGGLPLPYNAVSGLYFPVWWILAALQVAPTIGILTGVQVVHVFIGAAGVFFLARSHRLTWRWSLLAATAYLFFGGFYGNGLHDVIVRGHAYAPWLLWTLTLPRDGGPWRRILALPVVVWLIASGAYPGQAITFMQVAAVYLAVELWVSRRRLRQVAPSLILALIASGAIFVAVYLPYLAASSSGELFRPNPPTAQERALWSMHLVDLLGLYLDPFAWKTVEATVTSWSMGVVVLLGAVCCLDRKSITRSLTLITGGLTATALAMLPAWAPAGRVMASVPWLFPSRLPGSDSKAIVAVALVCLSALGWSRITAGEKPGPVPLIAGALILLGLSIAPQLTAIPPTKLHWLVVGLVLVCLLLIYRNRHLSRNVAFAALLLLTVVEGGRLVSEMETLPGEKPGLPGQRPWSLPPEHFPDRELHNVRARTFKNTVNDPPQRRPARVPAISPELPGGNPDDAIGFLGTTYRLGDYGGTVTMARHRVMEDPRLTELMLKPWTAWVWTCGEVECTKDKLPLPPEFAGRESTGVITTSYGLSKVSYEVSLPERSLMIENEIPAPGWAASRSDIRPVTIGGALRGWALPAGTYEFTATYVQPERSAQLALAAVALAMMLTASILFLRGKRRLKPLQRSSIGSGS